MNSQIFYNKDEFYNNFLIEWLYDYILNNKDKTIALVDLRDYDAYEIFYEIKNKFSREDFKDKSYYSFKLLNGCRLCYCGSNSIHALRGLTLNTIILNNYNTWLNYNQENFFRSIIPCMAYRKNSTVIFGLHSQYKCSHRIIDYINQVQKI